MTAQSRDYLYGGDYAQERDRLAGIEALWDPGSRSVLGELGVGTGWRCLEVGVLAAADADATAARFADPSMRIFTPIVMAGIGRRA
jgi:hypothetical protein